MRKVFLFTLVISVLSFNKLFAFAPPMAGNYTINSGLATGGKNFQTFTEAALALQAGVSAPIIFDVAPGSGPYNEQVIIYAIPGSSSTNTITFNCNGVTLTFNSTNSTQWAGVKLDGAHHVIFDNLVVLPQVTTYFEYGYGFHLVRDADSNIIRKCTVTNAFTGDAIGNPIQNLSGIVINGSDQDGTGVSHCDYNIITQNTVSGGYYGIILNSMDQSLLPTVITMDNNQVTNNIVKNFWYIGIEVLWCSNTLIEGNDVSGSFRGNYCTGIQLTEANYSNIVRGNRIHNFRLDPTAPYPGTRTGIGIDNCPAAAGRENLVINNLVYDFDSPEEFQGIKLSSSTKYLKLYHNTVSFDNASPTGTTITAFYMGDKQLNHLDVRNNIFTVTAAGSGTKRAVLSDGLQPLSTFDRNDYYASSSTGTVALTKYNGKTFTTLAAYQAALFQDYHSLSVDPVYTNAATGNYTPTVTVIDNRGAYVGVDKDILGTARNNASPDIGAFEMVSAACSAPPVAGATVIYPATTVCTNTVVALELSGNSLGSGQTYQWQSCPTATGAFSNTGIVSGSPGTDVVPNTTLYYRAQVTCGGNTVYSNPVQVIVNPYLPVGNYTINAGLPTAGTNFHSFNDAVLAMSCGIGGPVVFNVVPGSGPYTEQVIIRNIPNASKTNTITFNGNGETLQYTSTNTNFREVIKLDSARCITFDSLKITATGSSATEYGWAVHLMNDADNNIIRKCTITSTITSTSTSSFMGVIINASPTTAYGSGISNCDSNQVINNTIIGGYYNVQITSNDNPVENKTHCNVVTGNLLKEAYGYGIYTAGTDSLIIENNEITRPARTNTSGSFYGIYTGVGTTRFRVSKNKIHNFSGAALTASTTLYGIYTGAADGVPGSPNIISNNLMYDFNGSSVQYGIYNSGSDYALYYHNTISMDDTTATYAKATNGFYQTGDAIGIELKNNIFTMRRTNTAINYVVNMRSPGTVYTADYNDYLMANTGYTKMGYANGTAYVALADWQTGVTQDAHSLALNPGYEAPATGNFKPSASNTAPAAFNDKGTPVGIATDLVNFSRSATVPDIGAYEFGCSTFPGAGVVADSIAVCSGSPVSFQIKTPEAGVSYTWYTTATGGSPVFTGNPYTVNNVTAPIGFWVKGATAIGCTNGLFTHVKAVVYAKLAQPVATLDTTGVDILRFKWNAVPGATGYLVSRDGVNFITPSSGATGLTHTITGLNPLDTAGLVVKAVGVLACQEAVSARVSGRTRSNEFFVPNTFTPNGDGRNDVFRVYGNTIKSIRVMVFNQWGEKVFETSSLGGGWDGIYKGAPAPIGVYVYVVNLTLADGTVTVKKGSLNLVR